MTDLLKETEALPETYPTLLPDDDVVAAVWQRIEAYTAHRWTPRGVVWIVAGPGEWTPRLIPATVTLIERWGATAWQPVDLQPSPLGGFELDGAGHYRITATVGGGDVPQAVHEAYRRLVAYLADDPDRSGASSYSLNIGGAFQESYERNPAWQARALDLSGAADLLRPYRRA